MNKKYPPNSKSHPEAEPDLVSPGDSPPRINYSVTTHNTKETSNIITNKPLTVDQPISLGDEVQPIYITVTTPAKENDIHLRICETNSLKKDICKFEAQLSAIKSYINC